MPNNSSKWVSEYYDSLGPEWRLTQDLLQETIDLFGIPMFFIPKEITTRDDIWGGHIGQNILDKSYEVTMALLTYENFSEAGTLFGKFGINVSDKIKLAMCQDTFEKITGYENGLTRVGDLIYVPTLKKCGKAFWEVRAVDPNDRNKLMMFGANHVYIFSANVLKLDVTDKFESPVSDINEVQSFVDEIGNLEKTEVDRQTTTVAPALNDFSETDPFSGNR